MNKEAILFGLNYSKHPDARLRGCINDVKNVETFLKANAFSTVRTYTDDDIDPQRERTTGRGIVRTLDEMAWRSYTKKIDFLWIHFSGHGTSVKDQSRDERDGMDECFVPSDYDRVGVIRDDLFKKLFRKFSPRTRIFCVFDCCHSGTIGDLKYKYIDRNNMQLVPIVDNVSTPCKAPIVIFSGCKDTQTSADAFNVQHLGKFTGAMTSCLLTELGKHKCYTNVDIFELLINVRKLLREKRFSQYPQLTSSFVFDEHKKFYFKPADTRYR